MERRTFVSMAAAAGASRLFQRAPMRSPRPGPERRPGARAFRDGSCWSEVIARLQPKDIQVTSVQNPLTTLQAGVEATQRALALQQGPTVWSVILSPA